MQAYCCFKMRRFSLWKGEGGGGNWGDGNEGDAK